jgi:hypothetical protein
LRLGAVANPARSRAEAAWKQAGLIFSGAKHERGAGTVRTLELTPNLLETERSRPAARQASVTTLCATIATFGSAITIGSRLLSRGCTLVAQLRNGITISAGSLPRHRASVVTLRHHRPPDHRRRPADPRPRFVRRDR